MPTLEERVQALEQESAERKKRVQALEQENTELKQKIELHTIAIGGLINKAMLESLNEKNDKIFKALENHDKLTNMQLAELREKVEVDIEGKLVGLQTETHQHFIQIEGTQTELDGKLVGLHTETRQRFTQIEGTQQEHTTALAEQKSLLTEQKNLLTAILARLPEK